MDDFISAFFVGAIISFVISLVIGILKLLTGTAPKEDKQNNAISTADELLKFKKLLDEGVITQEEFYQKKKQLLNFCWQKQKRPVLLLRRRLRQNVFLQKKNVPLQKKRRDAIRHIGQNTQKKEVRFLPKEGKLKRR